MFVTLQTVFECDRLGSLLRYVGTLATSVYLVTGGYALDLTQLGIPLQQVGSMNEESPPSFGPGVSTPIH
ncbi:hypothetical protein [Spirulina subsalsa]|uniref:hypothetical protein n=1 Tax=Spirulina subsalsa TaxID=54311 RepID=UPI0002E33FF4|nr:hypothetical protein [Spirulina subsalsa]